MQLRYPYVGVTPPSGITISDLDELLHRCCDDATPRAGFPYPAESPTCWIKYGFSVEWNEVCAQVLAYHGLRGQPGCQTRAPGVFYARFDDPITCIVMEYIPGKTARQCMKASLDGAAKELVRQSVSRAIGDLHRIQIDVNTRPAAVSGDKIRHFGVFERDGAPCHYENVQQMEDHFNAVCGICPHLVVHCLGPRSDKPI